MNLIKTHSLIEQHLHGAYGVDFLNCSESELLEVAQKFVSDGVTVFLPTLVTAPVGQLKKQIETIKKAMASQEKMSKSERGAKIFGVNLEACFISQEKCGIHDTTQLLAPTVENFKFLEDESIRLVTIAPELDKNSELTNYLRNKDIKVFAGHTLTADLSRVDGVTHLFNAMGGISHREKTTATSALVNDDLFCELIADGFHVDYDVVKLVFKAKPQDKVILISDALPIAHSDKTEMEFCSKTIYLKDGRATDVNGTLAGSSMLLVDIVRKLAKSNLLQLEVAAKMASNSASLFGFEHNDCIYWDKELNIVDVSIN